MVSDDKGPIGGGGVQGTARVEQEEDEASWEPLSQQPDNDEPPLHRNEGRQAQLPSSSSYSSSSSSTLRQNDQQQQHGNQLRQRRKSARGSRDRERVGSSSSSNRRSNGSSSSNHRRNSATTSIVPTSSTRRRRRNSNNATTNTTIISHPLRHMAGHLIWHACRQIWTCGDGWTRSAIVSALVGGMFQIIYSIFWYALYPHLALSTAAAMAAAAVPCVIYAKPALEQLVRELQQQQQSPVDVWIDWLQRGLTSQQMRSLAALGVFVLPAVLEMRTLQFLSNLLVREDGAGGVAIRILPAFAFLLILGGGLAHGAWKKVKANQGNTDGEGEADTIPPQSASVLDKLSFYLSDLSPQPCSQFALYALYGTALWVVLVGNNHSWRHVPALAARFGLATAVLLWKSSRADRSQAVHNALRLTVRDALQEVGTSIQQDELLQLTMLRWLVDYWATTSTQTAASSSATSSNGTAQQQQQHQQRPTRPDEMQQPEMEWSEMFSMLQATTNQMSTEVEQLHQQQQEQQPQHQSSSQRETASELGESSGVETITTATMGPSSSSSPSETRNNTSSNFNASHAQQQQPPPPPANDPLQDLQTMLASINIDERAKPAVLAYKQMVESIPPSQRTAVVLALIRKSPAILLLVFYFVFGTVLGLYSASCWMIVMTILLPFATLEVWKMRLWMEACERAPRGSTANNATAENHEPAVDAWIFDSSVDSMTILLMDESIGVASTAGTTATTRLPTLLLVWRNVCSSVSALQVGLTAARCVQTSFVAVDFAANMISLVNLGLEISEHGWLHGVSVVARELLHLQQTGTDLTTLSHGVAAPAGASYTSAAVSAVRNSQTLNRNLRALATESENVAGGAVVVLGPMLAFFPLLIGHGWLWGGSREEQAAIQNESSAHLLSASSGRSTKIEIVELHDDEADHGRTSDSEEGAKDSAAAEDSLGRKDRSKINETTVGDNPHTTSAAPPVGSSSIENIVQATEFTWTTTTASENPPRDPVAGSNYENEVVSLRNNSVDGQTTQSQEHTVALETSKPASLTSLDDGGKTSGETVPLVSVDVPGTSVKKERSIDKVGQEIAAKFDDDSSELMELLAYCDEHSLIAHEEKNKILENLSTMSKKKSTSTSLAWTFGTKLTLQGLINQHNERTRGGCDDKNRLNVLNLSASNDEALLDHDGFEALHDEDFESLQFDSSPGKGALSVSSSEESPKCTLEVESPKASTSAASFGEDDDADFEPISSNSEENSQSIADSLKEEQSDPEAEIASSAVVTLESSAPFEKQRDEGDGDNLWLKLGGSFAVVGAVVGGVALAAAQNHGGEDQKRRDSKRENNK